jgi:multidrug transporter EmrE-like cation transporter
MKYAIIEASRPKLTPDTLLLTGAGIVLWISAFLALLIASVQRLPLARAAAVYTAAITATVLVIALGTFLTPPLTLAGICLIFLALVLVDEYSLTHGREALLPDWRRKDPDA